MGMEVSVTWAGGEVKEAYRAGAERGLFVAANHLLTEANRTVPWDQGPLERSGGVDVDRANLQASVYYDTPYARRQHEELGWNHPKKGRAKWLELTAQEQARTINEIVGHAMRVN